MKIKPLAETPEIKGISVNRCIETGKPLHGRQYAHAHNHRENDFFGWICCRFDYMGGYTLSCGEKWDGELTTMSPTLWHEYAHILTPNHGHDDAWRRKMRELGQRVSRRYRKKRRKKRKRR